MYYKIIYNGFVVDACDGLNFVRFQEKNSIFLSCEEEEADGIVSSNGSEIFLLNDIGSGETVYATYVEITKEEYDVLRDELDAGDSVPEDSGDEEPDTPAKTRLAILEETVAELSQTNWMLVECLLEMSEIVYGGDL